MTQTLKTSLVIDFSSNNDQHLSVEVDDRPSGYNGGVTTFYNGDSPAFLVYRSPAVVMKSVLVTEGTLQGLGGGRTVVDEWLMCAMESSVSLKLPSYANFTVLLAHGDALGNYQVIGKEMKFSSPKLAVIHVQYETDFLAYRITGNLGAVPIIAYAVGEVP